MIRSVLVLLGVVSVIGLRLKTHECGYDITEVRQHYYHFVDSEGSPVCKWLEKDLNAEKELMLNLATIYSVGKMPGQCNPQTVSKEERETFIKNADDVKAKILSTKTALLNSNDSQKKEAGKQLEEFEAGFQSCLKLLTSPVAESNKASIGSFIPIPLPFSLSNSNSNQMTQQIQKLEQDRNQREKQLNERQAEIQKYKHRLQQVKQKQRLEAERIAKQKAQQERLAKQKAEKERLQKQRLQQERIAKQKAEQQRLQKQRLQKQRLQKQRLQKQRLEKLQQQRLQKQRLEQQRIARQKAQQQRLEKQRLQQQIIAQQKAQQQARIKAQQQRLAKQKAQAQKIAQQKAQQQRIAAQKQKQRQADEQKQAALLRQKKQQQQKQLKQQALQKQQKVAKAKQQQENRLLDQKRLKQQREEQQNQKQQEIKTKAEEAKRVEQQKIREAKIQKQNIKAQQKLRLIAIQKQQQQVEQKQPTIVAPIPVPIIPLSSQGPLPKQYVTNPLAPNIIIDNRTEIKERYKRNLDDNTKDYDACPMSTPYFDGENCINCKQLFNLNTRECTSCPPDTKYDELTSKCIKTIFVTNLNAENLLFKERNIDQWKTFQERLRSTSPSTIVQCPLDKPFATSSQCIQCPSDTPLFDIITSSCMKCPDGEEYNKQQRKCLKKSNTITSVDNTVATATATTAATVAAVTATTSPTNTPLPVNYLTNPSVHGLIIDTGSLQQYTANYKSSKQDTTKSSQDCPTNLPYFNGKQCIACQGQNNLFKVSTKQCTKCQAGYQYFYQFKSCLLLNKSQ